LRPPQARQPGGTDQRRGRAEGCQRGPNRAGEGWEPSLKQCWVGRCWVVGHAQVRGQLVCSRCLRPRGLALQAGALQGGPGPRLPGANQPKQLPPINAQDWLLGGRGEGRPGAAACAAAHEPAAAAAAGPLTRGLPAVPTPPAGPTVRCCFAAGSAGTAPSQLPAAGGAGSGVLRLSPAATCCCCAAGAVEAAAATGCCCGCSGERRAASGVAVRIGGSCLLLLRVAACEQLRHGPRHALHRNFAAGQQALQQSDLGRRRRRRGAVAADGAAAGAAASCGPAAAPCPPSVPCSCFNSSASLGLPA
jgi:hypothetical protein